MYNIDNCILIRTTNIFPCDGVIETPIHGNAYYSDESNYLKEVIEKYFGKYSDDYDIVCETKRTTVHFTINGLVANSMYGKFDYPFIILEPLKYHINDESLLSLRVEDTYFNDDVTLSNEAIIMIDESRFDELNDEYDLSKYNIQVYKGDRKEALKLLLDKKGYQYFEVNDHGYVEGLDETTDASKMYQFIAEYAYEHDIGQDKHFYSEINMSDALNREENKKDVSKRHLLYVMDNGVFTEKLVEEILPCIDNEIKVIRVLQNNIEKIDFDLLKEKTIEFNNMEIERLENSKQNVK